MNEKTINCASDEEELRALRQTIQVLQSRLKVTERPSAGVTTVHQHTVRCVCGQCGGTWTLTDGKQFGEKTRYCPWCGVELRVKR